VVVEAELEFLGLFFVKELAWFLLKLMQIRRQSSEENTYPAFRGDSFEDNRRFRV